MIENTKKILNLLIMLIGLAIVARSVAVAGALSFTTGMVAGLAFAAYGAVRLYYMRGGS